MARTIEYCLNNVDADARRRLGECETGDTLETRCLQRCGDCYRSPFLVVDGELATGGSHADILSALAEKAEEAEGTEGAE